MFCINFLLVVKYDALIRRLSLFKSVTSVPGLYKSGLGIGFQNVSLLG